MLLFSNPATGMAGWLLQRLRRLVRLSQVQTDEDLRLRGCVVCVSLSLISPLSSLSSLCVCLCVRDYAPAYLPPSALGKPQLSTGDNQGSTFNTAQVHTRGGLETANTHAKKKKIRSTV